MERLGYRVQANFSATQVAALEEFARAEGIPVAQVIRNAVTLYMLMAEANGEGLVKP